MGKIFGISDNPVSTIESTLKGMQNVDPPIRQHVRMTTDSIDKYSFSGKKSRPDLKNTTKLIKRMLSYFKK